MGANDPVIHHTHDLRANMRDVRSAGERPYAAHVGGRNSYRAGLAACAMRDARPHDFGAFPITPIQIDALCVLAARIADAYGIATSAIGTHAEAALEDGYYGAGEDERWDIARLVPSAQPLARAEATATGDAFRQRIAALRARA